MRPLSPILQHKPSTVKRLLPFALILVLGASCATPKDFEYREIRNIRVGKIGFAATDLNLELAAGMGFPPPADAGPNDMLVALAGGPLPH